MGKYTTLDSENDSSARGSAEDSISEAEKEQLLDPLSLAKSPLKSKKKIRLHRCVTAFLCLSNVVLLGLLLSLAPKRDPEPQKSWLPPETTKHEIFTFHPIFAEPPSEESDKAWNELMPVGRGFVTIKNDTALPDLPGVDQSLVDQKAMVSTFHQIHCLFTIREGYFSVREGDFDKVPPGHMLHCWDYLRQAIMCFADTTLEWLPAPPNDKGSTGWHYQHKCRDFQAISRWVEANRVNSKTGIH